MGEIESPKAVSVLYAPCSIKITENNESIEDDYSVINKDADKTWLFKAEVQNSEELENLMNEE